jgi:hypothetical protein
MLGARQRKRVDRLVTLILARKTREGAAHWWPGQYRTAHVLLDQNFDHASLDAAGIPAKANKLTPQERISNLQGHLKRTGSE